MKLDYEQKIIEQIKAATSKGIRIGQLFDNCKSRMRKDGIDMFFADNHTLLKYITFFTNPQKTIEQRIKNLEEHLIRLEIDICNSKNTSCTHCTCHEK